MNLTGPQLRALKLAGTEGILSFNGRRWKPPSLIGKLSPSEDYERSPTVFALERLGLLAPDPRFKRGELGDHPRPRVITAAGRAELKRREATSGSRTPIGLADKLYWRPVGPVPEPRVQVWHCFKKLRGKKGEKDLWGSLCGDHVRTKSGGQSCQRPRVVLRCARCDGAEMKRRGWEESGPESKAS